MPAQTRLNTLRKVFCSQPIETYVLLALPALIILLVILCKPAQSASSAPSTIDVIIKSFFLGGGYLAIATLLLVLGILIRLAYVAITRRFLSASGKVITRDKILLGTRSGIYIVLVASFATAAIALIVVRLAFVSPAEVSSTSQMIMSFDRSFFGVHLPFWLHSSPAIPALDWFIISSYRYIGFFLAFMFVALIIKNRALFRQFLLAFFIIPILSMPFWLALPAISPDEMYRMNILRNAAPPEIQKDIAIENNLTPKLKAYLIELESVYIDKEGVMFAVTTFPSAHAAWGFIIAYFAILLWQPLGFILIPWAIGNTIGTAYTLQHYGVDAIFGLVIAITAIVATRLLLRAEEKYYSGNWQPFYLVDVLISEIHGIGQRFVKTFTTNARSHD